MIEVEAKPRSKAKALHYVSMVGFTTANYNYNNNNTNLCVPFHITSLIRERAPLQ